MEEDKLARIKELEQKIIHHKTLYYRGETEISDAEYDALEDELKKLSPTSPALELVGSAFLAKEVPHEVPMLSLGKSRDPKDIENWLRAANIKEQKSLAKAKGVSADKVELAFEKALVSVKMDGSSASLIYKDGRFVSASTRGDGYFGENISAQLSFASFPKEVLLGGKIKNFEIRGEVCISKENFGALSQKIIEKNIAERKAEEKAIDQVAEGGEKNIEGPKSIRNIVAGLLHTKADNSAIANCSFLDFIAYEIIAPAMDIKSEEEKFLLLADAGFIVPPHWLWEKDGDFADIIKEYRQLCEEFPYLSDGLVIAIDNLKRQKARGLTAHHPKGKMAFKFQAETAKTTLREVEISIGRTGKLSFVGIVDPVNLSGATVSRVTLHNSSYIEAEELGVGAVIEISRSGEVIPKHERTLVPAKEPLPMPEKCPYCGAPLSRSESGVDLLCQNEACFGRRVNALLYFINTCGIEFIGERTLWRLMAEEKVKNISDLYRLDAEKLQVLKQGDSVSDKLEQKILNSIDEHRVLPLNTFLAACGIDGFGHAAVKALLEKHPKITELKELKSAEICQISGLGEVLSKNIEEGLKEKAWPLLDALTAAGVRVITAAGSGPLKDLTFVVTGSLEHISRKEAEERIERLGGTFSSSVGKKTSYLVCNKPSNSTKYQRALSYGVKIINEEELLRLLNGEAPAAETAGASSGPQQLEIF